MIVISDTNVLSSLAAGDSFHLLLQLYPRAKLSVPQIVLDELQAGDDAGTSYLQPVLQAIRAHQIHVLPLTPEEELLTFQYPNNLDAGERQAIALAQIRKATLLGNDKNAIRYCKQKGIRVVSLVGILRLLWMEQVIAQDDVRLLIGRMEQVESLTLTPSQLTEIFAPKTTV